MLNDIQIKIPVYNFSELTKRIEKVNKKAEKWGMEKISINVEKEYFRDKPGVDVEMCNLYDIPVPKIKMFSVSLSGITPKMEGWEFIATLDHTTIPGSVIVKTVPGASSITPKAYYDHNGSCDHCQKIRSRKETFVLYNEENKDYKAVGRQCIKDFLGHELRGIVGRLDIVNSISDLSDENFERNFGGGYIEPIYSLNEVLNLTVSVIRKFGWMSNSAAKTINENAEGEETASVMSTSSIVSYIISGPYSHLDDNRTWKEYIQDLVKKDSDKTLVEDAIKWVETSESDNEYFHNLKKIVESKFISKKLFGFACSIVSSYQKSLQKEEELVNKKKEEKLNVEDVPEGEGVLISGTVLKTETKYYDNFTRRVMTVKDERGFLVWGGLPASIDDAEVGDKVSFKVRELKKSDNDSKFGFYKRPSKAVIVEKKNSENGEAYYG